MKQQKEYTITYTAEEYKFILAVMEQLAPRVQYITTPAVQVYSRMSKQLKENV